MQHMNRNQGQTVIESKDMGLRPRTQADSRHQKVNFVDGRVDGIRNPEFCPWTVLTSKSELSVLRWTACGGCQLSRLATADDLHGGASYSGSRPIPSPNG
jgi:hypothetical protein